MFAYPKQAEFNRLIPKAKLYAYGRVSRRVKDLFVAQVDEVVWKYKLSPETINLPERDGIREIQVFELSLRTAELDDGVLEAIDRAVPFPILFQISHDEHVRYAASYKRPSESDPSKWVIEARFITALTPRSALTLAPLPVALDLASLHAQLVRRHIPLAPRIGESLSEQVQRYQEVSAARKRQHQLEGRLVREKQFNRRVELNAALRALTDELEALQNV